MSHEGPGHGDATLSLTEETADGGHLYQSWIICECNLAGLRARLGPPEHETTATAESVLAAAQAVLNTPGRVHWS